VVLLNIIKKVPLPICGVILGTAALGNLLQSYSEGVRYVCGIFAAFLLILFILKLIIYPQMFIEDMKNPIMASVSGTLPMALMILSTYVKPFIGKVAYAVWLIAIALHIVLIVYFTVKFIFKLQLSKVFASYFIVYVGIVVASITAPAYAQEDFIGTIAFWFGFIALILLLVLVTLRYIRCREVPEPAKPLICIYTAPVSLCIAGYVQSVTPKSYIFLVAMLAVASLIYIFALIKAIYYLRLKFYPSYAAFTFPFVISAIAIKQTMACAAKLGQPMPWLSGIVLVETVIAVILVVYTYIRFVKFIFADK
jgi:exfoliative toxin A/B